MHTLKKEYLVQKLVAWKMTALNKLYGLQWLRGD